ncbi:hypothetical protein C0Q44_27130 [Paenibacillus sp. PCH8]|uniref:hypothetical protein n=1 Tax=Paenibacillus sp. PCH8 TaxID=2066524 RepID=UPI000CFA61EA|nr:hypothetical protein [Paenibacillus sp. PCH8]PQP80458.1 hypothetical protein C0Q44_27130 [Paenibacillus sp. PCH8]
MKKRRLAILLIILSLILCMSITERVEAKEENEKKEVINQISMADVHYLILEEMDQCGQRVPKE